MPETPATSSAQYRQHLAALDGFLTDALTRAAQKGRKLEAVLLHAGRSSEYHRDDQEIPFRPTPHLLRYVPLQGPEHCVLARPGKTPLVIRVAPRDYWYEVVPLAPSFWQSEVELIEVTSLKEAKSALGALAATAYVGNSRAAAAELGIPDELVEPAELMAPLDWHRATKTEHEVALLRAAAHSAAKGHEQARAAFLAGASEREIHWCYLRASLQLEREIPYENIVALDEKSATLHYQNKRTEIPTAKQTFLLDAGAASGGYAADITRTWVDSRISPTFRGLLVGLDAAQRELVSMVTAGRPYLDIHLAAHEKVAALLVESGVVRASASEALARGVTRTFLPHGVGHHLGLQVHDVGGRQAGPDGGAKMPPAEHPFLRNTRILAPGHLVTIEPGIYFIPMLLDRLRASEEGKLCEWRLIESLIPCGGMRIEDDVLCTPAAPNDLTRDLIAGPRGL